ncbi:UDP-N-acetylmuramate dehydrogenase [Gulosibacter molinativorax]|uniref:UDP-N-acetylenolpyruvoylglucosamine reductase n=1 Tax=Gulosibacter molinativorax TaxID=256821 RepID=A0ABT7CAK3_9MICO|nr:UDP-N-acetylmuramate dehydrogenase [Gulosibacter molinativorax]MDJ1372232.1 UDP-N-acetylmuramate dehydrogenase [Gulosibacter molinativorax]QUY63486.1 UDP-N-acetylenolpyruvoylglucosamine reductase [Gulosibacter molinativorax]
MTTFAQLTTTAVSDAEADLVVPESREALIDAYLELVDEREPFLIIGGGSNTIVSDDGFPGRVLKIETRGLEFEDADGHVLVRAEAGESWPGLVDRAVFEGLSGIEALAGIPGSVGATPVQNIGAYGQELSDVLTRVELLDADTGAVEWVDAADLGLGYRTSVLKRRERVGLVLRVELRLTRVGDGAGAPVQYAQLAKALGVEIGDRVDVAAQRDAVLRLRATKGMVLDASDPDTRSSGSFFVNPIVRHDFARELPSEAPRFPAGEGEDGEPLSKLSAAWLIDHAGVKRGFALPGSGAAISSKHTLAITNHDGATAQDIVELARFVRARVQQEFGVVLIPEPNLIGLEI